MTAPPRTLEFDPLVDAQIARVLDRMAPMVAAHRGWVNFEPLIPEGDVPIPSTGGVFSNKGPAIPLCTWTPPTVDKKGRVGPQSIGVQHAVGSRARPYLADLRLEVPEGWRVRADNPKRGMVVEIPADADLAMVLDWLIAAGEALAQVPLTGRWLAVVYTG